MENRIIWDEYFMEMTHLISKRVTCPRKHVGAIIVEDNRVIAIGYNGAPKKFEQCDEVGCLMKDGHCIRVLHAEQSALLQAEREAEGATLYCITLSCEICFKLCIQAGIKRIFYAEDYNKDDLKYWINHSKVVVQKYLKERD
jgi:dCMP deaminase